MLLDGLLKGLHLLLSVVLGAIDELSQVDELFFVLWALSNALLHVVEGRRDVLHGLTAPIVDTLNELHLDGIGLLGETLLQVVGLHLEDRELHDVVGDVEDLVLSLMVLVELRSDLLVGGFLLSVLLRDGPLEEVPDEALLVDVENVLVLLILLKESSGGDLVLLEHGLNLGTGLLEPLEVRW